MLGGLIPYDKIFKEVTFKANQVLVKENIRKELDSKFSNLRDGTSRKYKDSVYTWLAIDKEARARDTISNMPVSYTHLDVYKRQYLYHILKNC